MKLLILSILISSVSYAEYINLRTSPTIIIGPTGATGAQGSQGSQGIQGMIGSTGSTGSSGLTGSQGNQGIKGDTGTAGTNGTNGTNGATGSIGATGPSGVVAATSPLAYNSGTQTVSIQSASSSQAGSLSTANWTTFNNKFGAVTYTASTPSRTLNTNFTPSATNAVNVCYTFKISCSISLGGTCDGNVELRSDTNATPTTVRGRTQMSLGGTLLIGLIVSNSKEAPLCYLVPPNNNVRLVSTTISGSPNITMLIQAETAISFGP